jgi:RNA polymerase sigma-70 factor (ECF subfamily)
MPISSHSTSLRLLDRLGCGDPDAWRQMVGLYTPLLRAWLRPAGLQSSDIDDLTQTALAVVVRRLPEYRHNGRRGAFRAWLRSIIGNVLREFLRATDRRAARERALLDELEDGTSALSRRWDAEHDRFMLRGLLELIRGEFTPPKWAAFCHTALDGFAASKVAAELSLTPNAVHVARSRVLARLRSEAADFIAVL